MKQAFESVALLAALLATGVSAAAYPDTPPVVLPDPGENGPALIAWQAVGIECAEGALPAAAIVPPYPRSGWAGLRVAQAEYLFSVDGSGRPIDIHRPDGASYVPMSDDLAPALAASRFAAGAPRHDCRVTFRPGVMPVRVAPVSDVMALAVQGGVRQKAIAERIRPAGSTCFDPPPAPLMRAFPDFAEVPRVPGRLSWSMIGFDTSASGMPVAPHLVGGSGNAALDGAARDAVARSRFVKGARHGCLYPYWLSAGTLKAPDMPDAATVRPAGATCPEVLSWLGRLDMQYPANYRRRAVEGWAIVAFDTAPWGATGNLRVIAAQPSADFGQAAMNMLRSARLAPSNAGYVGCVERVRFAMPDGPRGVDTGDQG